MKNSIFNTARAVAPVSGILSTRKGLIAMSIQNDNRKMTVFNRLAEIAMQVKKMIKPAVATIAKNILIITTLLCLIGFATACENKITDANDYIKKDDNTLQGDKSLIGVWKLTAFVDVENNTIREPDYAPEVANAVNIIIDSMYLLSFDCDSLLSGKSFSNWLDGKYSIVGNDGITMGVGGTKINEFGDGELYRQVLNEVQQYAITETNELKLFYNNKKNYLFFRRQQ